VQIYEIFVENSIIPLLSFLAPISRALSGASDSFSGAVSCYPLYLFRQIIYGRISHFSLA
jgi:hypothetical protein